VQRVVRRVLVVDDDPVTLTTHARILSLEGYDVTAADGGRQALALLQTRPFDLLLTDHRMPDVSGLELLAEARECAPHIPVVLYTAMGTRALETAARHLGAAHFSASLWDSKSLVQAVERHLRPKVDRVERRSAESQIGPASRRWLSLVTGLCSLNEDIRTLRDLGEELGYSERTIKRYCALCDVGAADTLNFARALRVVMQHGGQRIDWYNTLNISDSTTMKTFLARAGFMRDAVVPGRKSFIEHQRFIASVDLLSAVTAALISWPNI